MHNETKQLSSQILNKINTKTKPVGSLGQLEQVAYQIALSQKTTTPKLIAPTILIFAGDHGIANRGVSAYPKEVTQQMVLNFASGGAAINVFCKQNHINLKVIDAGVDFDFDPSMNIADYKVAHGTKDYFNNSAMTSKQYQQALASGRNIVLQIHQESKTNILGFGEMGIANTSAASLLMHHLCGIKLKSCIGAGTGLDQKGQKKKFEVLNQAKRFHKLESFTQSKTSAAESIAYIEKLAQTFAGFEMVMLLGAMLQANELNITLLIDGFIATSVFLMAHALNPDIKKNSIFCHQSDESGHKKMLEYLQVVPLLKLNLRLGEGSGCALAYPLVVSAINFFNQMSSFENAGVSESS